MKQDSILIGATKKEVINIGWNRHFRKNWLRLLTPVVIAFVAFVVATYLVPTEWVWWTRLLVFLTLAALFIWTYFRIFAVCRKAGRELLKQLLEKTEK